MQNATSFTVYRSLFAAVRFFYENGPRMVGLSVVWFLCSLPVVTIGPSTLGAYGAILSLREEQAFDYDRIRTLLGRHGLSSVLLTGLPVLLAATGALYVRRYFATESTVALVLAVVTLYAAAYAALVLIPTFVELANGAPLEQSIRSGIRWTSANAVGAIAMAMATLMLFVLAGALTVAFVLVFAGIAFSLHLDVLAPTVAE
ncbi:hypothetical protein ACOZ4I_08505 [Haloarcula salina]|uniref:hypothetical protein n=1 Tax=Haloarcula salina TaxID=1429914 RepID=UPI003C6F5EE4